MSSWEKFDSDFTAKKLNVFDMTSSIYHNLCCLLLTLRQISNFFYSTLQDSWCHSPAAVAILREDADGFVKAGRNKLLPCGGVIHIEHSRDMVHVHQDWPFQVPHVIRVQTGEKTNIKNEVKQLERTHTELTCSPHLKL